MFTIIDLELALLFIALSLLSGIGAYLQAARHKAEFRGLFHFLSEVVTALISGLFVAFIGVHINMKPALTCAMVLIASNNGAEMLSIVKDSVIKKYKVITEGKV